MAYAYDKDDDNTPEGKLDQWKKEYKYALDYWKPQHDRSDEDVAFQIGDNQWSQEAKEERDKQKRPRISISLLQQPQQLVQNQAANARMGINFHPVNESADS